MVRKSSELTMNELDGDMVEIELLVKNLMIVEHGEQTGMENIIDTEYVKRLDTTKTNPSTVQIQWADKQMDTVNLEEGIMNDVDRAGDIMEMDTELKVTTNTRSNRLSNGLLVMTGQRNGPPLMFQKWNVAGGRMNVRY